MTKKEQYSPPGHTKPPITGTRGKKLAAMPAFNIDPRNLPKKAQQVLLVSAALTFIVMMMDPEPMSTITMVVLLSIGAFAETRPEDDPAKPRTLWQIYDRAFSHALWIAVSVLPILLLATGLRRLLGFGVGQE